MPRRNRRRHRTPAEPEKPFEALAEQAQQARTQFFVYLATVTFLLVTVLSITDKQLLLNNSLVTLPLINVSVEPKAVLILGPILLLITFCNLHIHWFRYVKEVQTLGLTPQAEQRKLFPLMLYQALYHPHQGFVGILESFSAWLALFGLLVPVQICILFQTSKLNETLFTVTAILGVIASLVLTLYWIGKRSKKVIPTLSLGGIRLPLIDELIRILPLILDIIRQIFNVTPSEIRRLTFSILLISTILLKGLFSKDISSIFSFSPPHLDVTYSILSPPPELLDTPIVTPFLERLNREAFTEAETSQQQPSADKTKTPTRETPTVFDGVYWLDLRNKSLAWADLEGSILLKTNFEGVHLEHSTLNGVDLRYSNLKHVHLNHANLVGAKLNHADLGYAKLYHADLGYAKLNQAYLYETDLIGVYFALKWDAKTKKNIPAYGVGGEALCQAKTLEYAQMDDWLFKKLKTIKACNGKLKRVRTSNYPLIPITELLATKR
jgi:hypothetical protein